MNRGLSLYLDLVRALAAFEVFLFHMRRFTAGTGFHWWNRWGHEAVVLFFVLSGYVISYAADTRDRSLERYAVSRATRIFSVTLPALLLTVAFDRIGSGLAPDLYAPVLSFDRFWLRLAACALLLNESWVSIQAFSNTPYWSIAYEFAYYFLFAAGFFLTGWRRWLLAIAVAVVAGPRILLLFPIWLMGSWAYRERISESWPRAVHWLLFLSIVPAFWAYGHFDAQNVLGAPVIDLLGEARAKTWLNWSRWVIPDTLLGIAVTAHFVGARGVALTFEPALARVSVPLRWAAGLSFTLYLLHQPAVLLVNALLLRWRAQPWLPCAVAAGTLAIVAGVGAATEAQRHRLRPAVAWIVARVAHPFRLRAA